MHNNLSTDDTIAAIATPIGQAGIGIVRISGPRARAIAKKVFQPNKPLKDLESHQLYLGHLIDPVSGHTIDEVLFSFMMAPHSYTGEDVAEINSHSGYFLLSSILRIVLEAGARIAKPGEFTFRAFVNGRIDLTQAEAVIDLINSKSERGLELASRQIMGKFRDEIESLRRKAVEFLAHTEAAIDFPEEENTVMPGEEAAERIEKELILPIKKIIAAHSQRKIWMDGIHVVIAGRVNAGKSSLLNRLLNEDRAIVTPIPGTTRDIIESTIHIEGLPIRLMDTAGFRRVKGEVEKIGIRLTEQKLAEADLILIVIDGNRPLNKEDFNIIARSEKTKGLIIINKIDLPIKIDEKALKEATGDMPSVNISALTGEGIEYLKQAIRDLVLTNKTDMDATQAVPNLRHKEALEKASQYFINTQNNLKDGLPMEIIAMDLNGGLEALGEIVGKTSHDDILNRIFSQFCLGK